MKFQLERWLTIQSRCFHEAEDLRSQGKASTAQSLGQAAFDSVVPPTVSPVSSVDGDLKDYVSTGGVGKFSGVPPKPGGVCTEILGEWVGGRKTDSR